MFRGGSLTAFAVGLGKWVVLLCGLGATFGIFALVSFQLALRSREVPVPDISGLTPPEAEQLLDAAGLSVQIDPVSRVHDSITVGRIAAQAPGAGLLTRRGRSVQAWLSSGLTPGSLPFLIGASERAARQRLEENAFAVDGLSEIRSSRYPVDAVVAQVRTGDSSAQRVSLLVNRGERGVTYVMPDLIRLDSTAAAALLRARGFRITVVSDHPYTRVPPGIILRQSPEAGYQIAPGELIRIEVSR